MTAEPAAATRHASTYPGRADQVRHVRQAITLHLTGCPVADDAVLVASELASNAILHSRSRGGQFIIRAELHPDHVLVEAEDLGGPWRPRRSGDRPHGLNLVEALAGPEGWGVKTTGDGGRIVWARLNLATEGE
jgi:anti-sigma regulatory factor (Ser/Thr protein kinase)